MSSRNYHGGVSKRCDIQKTTILTIHVYRPIFLHSHPLVFHLRTYGQIRKMLIKIISGGQTGVDRAALDAAIKAGVDHGGWIPKGRLTEDGPLPDKYNLKEMPTASYPKRTEQNVIDSDGTLIISHGDLTGGSLLTQKLAMDQGKEWKHIDLDKNIAFRAVKEIAEWIDDNDIEILNVAGPRASKDPTLYKLVVIFIGMVYQMGLCNIGNPNENIPQIHIIEAPKDRPKTVKEAIDGIISEMGLREQSMFAHTKKDGYYIFEEIYKGYIRDKLQIWTPNKDLLESCRKAVGDPNLSMGEVPKVITREIWRKLRETHKLRRVK